MSESSAVDALAQVAGELRKECSCVVGGPNHGQCLNCDLSDRIETVRAVMGDLIEASRPFADLLQDHIEMDEHFNRRPAARPVFGINDAVITVGDLRTISRSLARCKGGAA